MNTAVTTQETSSTNTPTSLQALIDFICTGEEFALLRQTLTLYAQEDENTARQS